MTKTLILGAGGMLGRAMLVEAQRRGHAVDAPTHAELDLRDTERVGSRLESSGADVVINCAALTDVDGCEERKSEAFEINGHAVDRLGLLTERQGAMLLHVSTDYVFAGEADRPYRETDPTGPTSVYGESKLVGELALAERERALVVRTSWLFGPGGRNFVDTVVRRAMSGASLRVVQDQLGAPTYAPFLARALAELAERSLGGRLSLPRRLHYRNREPITWHGFAAAVVRTWGLECEVSPCSTADMPRPAPRPAYSVLDVGRCEGLLGRRVEEWSAGLELYRAVWRAPS